MTKQSMITILRITSILLATIVWCIKIATPQSFYRPPVTIQRQAWSPGVTLTFWVDPDFGNKQQTIINKITSFNYFGESYVFFVHTEIKPSIYLPNVLHVNHGADEQHEIGAAFGINALHLGDFWLKSAEVFIREDVAVYDTQLKRIISHELGHTFGLGDCSYCNYLESCMDLPTTTNPATAHFCGSEGFTTKDDWTAWIAWYAELEPIQIPPDQDEDGWLACGDPEFPYYEGKCDCWDEIPERNPDAQGVLCGEWGCDIAADVNCDGEDECLECSTTPILIDVLGNGFDLSNAEGGVFVDLDIDGLFELHAWTATNADDAWLVLDRNENGRIDNGLEFFGNYTPQPSSNEPNGFKALAVFDLREYGGNDNGVIDQGDTVFDRLRLWHDKNHNGMSETEELSPLVYAGIVGVELEYKSSMKRDQHGNRFRFRAKVIDARGEHVGRWAYDVFLIQKALLA